MNKFPVWMRIALVAGMVTALFVTSAFSVGNGAGIFGRGTGNANVRNGVVYAYTAGKFISIRGTGRVLYEYNITPKTVILPDNLAGTVGVGAQVAVVGQCYYTRFTNGCMALQIWVRLGAPGISHTK